MKNLDINIGFPQFEIREHVSKRLMEIFELETSNQKVIIPFDREDPILWNIHDSEENIKFEKRKLKYLKEKYALVIIGKERSWNEYDVSEITFLEPGQKHWISFGGTEEEYKQLIDKIHED